MYRKNALTSQLNLFDATTVKKHKMLHQHYKDYNSGLDILQHFYIKIDIKNTWLFVILLEFF